MKLFILLARVLLCLSVFMSPITFASGINQRDGKVGSIFKIDSEFCLINATPNQISIQNVLNSHQSDWDESTQPTQLVGQYVKGYASSCWPLSLTRKISNQYPFEIQVATSAGSVSWMVNQYDAVGEINARASMTSNASNYVVWQKSGDNNGYATNVFVIESLRDRMQYDLSRWMSFLRNSDTLKSIQLIGTHDSGVNREDTVSCNVPSALAIAQEWGISTQLKDGIRYFDIRLEDGANGQHFPYHETLRLGCSSKKSFEQSLSEMIQFVRLHPSEVVVVKLSHTSSTSESVVRMLDSFTQSKQWGSYFYKSSSDAYRWNDKTLSELRGKIVLLLDCEYDGFLDSRKGYFSFASSHQAACSPDSDNQVIYDKYSNTLNVDQMYQDQLNKLTKQSSSHDKLFLLSWTMTGGDIVAHTARPAAILANLSSERLGKSLPLPNIIYYDFEDPGLNELFISNFITHRTV